MFIPTNNRNVLFKATNMQSLPLIPSQIIQIRSMETYVDAPRWSAP